MSMKCVGGGIGSLGLAQVPLQVLVRQHEGLFRRHNECSNGRRGLKTRIQTGAKNSDKPQWVSDLEEDAPYDEGAARVLEGADGDPDKIRENMRKEQRLKLEEIISSKRGESSPMAIYFREADPFNLWIWMEFYAEPSQADKDLLKAALNAWYAVGKLGGYNGSNIQLARNADADLSYFEYDYEEMDDKRMGSFLHEMSSVEFKQEWARFRLDMGTSDELGLDVLINMLITFSEEHVGIKKLFFGGENQDWVLPKDAEERDQDPQDQKDFATFANAQALSKGTFQAGEKVNVGGMTYTIEDVPKAGD